MPLEEKSIKKVKTDGNVKPIKEPKNKDNGFRKKPKELEINKGFLPEYFIDGKLRKVKPYSHSYKTYCKKRWIAVPILMIFSTEFRDKDASYYKNAIKTGKVSINNKVMTDVNYKLRNGDLIQHVTHRHEPPVLAQLPQIIYENDNFLIINKPNGIPVHPTGRYTFNTVVKLIEFYNGIVSHPCNRLDRLTSGLMFLAKTSLGSKIMFEQLTKRNVEKYYIARVKGNFPLNMNNNKPGVNRHCLEVNKSMETVEPKLGLNRVVFGENEGKEAFTLFKRISYDKVSDTSIVKCQPLTGRTHQIRVHLQYLGYPIANDPIYSNIDIWGEDNQNLIRENKVDYSQIIEKLNLIGKSDPSSSWIYQKNKKPGLDSEDTRKMSEVLSGEVCEECELPLYNDPDPIDLELWLHAYKYQTKNYDEEYAKRKSVSSLEANRIKGIPDTNDKDSSKLPADGAESLNVETVSSEYSNIDDETFERWSFKTPLPSWALESSRKYMEEAIEQAKKCGPTSTAFNVGAVLVDSVKDEIISTGYSRELPGNTHAEQNAFTKYYDRTGNSSLPDGTVLYTTMEPCSLRLSGNKPCCDRIIETNGKIITCFVGVFEPKTFVKNNIGYEKLVHDGVEYVHIPGYEEKILEIATKGHNDK